MKDKELELYQKRLKEAMEEVMYDVECNNDHEIMAGLNEIAQLSFSEGKRRLLKTVLEKLHYNNVVIDNYIGETIREIEGL